VLDRGHHLALGRPVAGQLVGDPDTRWAALPLEQLAQQALGGVRVALPRAEAFQTALWRVFAPPPFDPATLADATVVCRCEEVTAGRLRAEIAGGLSSVAALKRATRAGMGPC